MSEFLHIVCPNCAAVNRVPESRFGEHPVCGKCAQALFDGLPVELTGATFTKHIGRNDIPVLVDFWAPWCGPCRMMAPAYEEAAKQLGSEMRVAKLNTEEAQQIAAQYVIRSIPTLALFYQGREIGRQAGAMDTGRIVAWARAQAQQVRAQT